MWKKLTLAGNHIINHKKKVISSSFISFERDLVNVTTHEVSDTIS